MRDRLLVGLYMLLLALPLAAYVARVPDAKLGGVTAAPAADVDPAERYQHAITTWFENKRGLRNWSIWFDNTLLHAVFGESRHGSRVMVGHDDVLFERDDIAYWNRSGDELPTPSQIAHWADQLARLQRHLATRGQTLVPVFVPSKTTMYPDKVPAMWTRPLGTPRPATARVYHQLRDELARRGVHHVDAIELTLRAPLPRDHAWGPSARHWSDIVGCLATRAILGSHLDRTGQPARDYPCTPLIRKVDRTHNDVDLYRLINAWGVRRDTIVRSVAPPPTPPTTKQLGMTVISGSFGWVFVGDAERSGHFDRLYINYYNSSIHSPFVPGYERTDPATPVWRKVLLEQDILVIEINESYVTKDDWFIASALDALAHATR